MNWDDELVTAYCLGAGIPDHVMLTEDLLTDLRTLVGMCIAEPSDNRENDLVRAWMDGAKTSMQNTNVEQESDPTQNPEIRVELLELIEETIRVRSNNP